MCSEVDILLAGLHHSCHAVHHCPQACVVLGLTPDMLSCPPDTPQATPMSSQPLTLSPASILKAQQQSLRQQQQYTLADQAHDSPQQSGSSLGRVTRVEEHALLSDEPVKAREALWQEGWLFGGMLSDAHRLWQHLIYDTQVVGVHPHLICINGSLKPESLDQNEAMWVKYILGLFYCGVHKGAVTIGSISCCSMDVMAHDLHCY